MPYGCEITVIAQEGLKTCYIDGYNNHIKVKGSLDLDVIVIMFQLVLN